MPTAMRTAMILPVSDKFNKYATRVLETLKEAGLRAELDDRAESVGKKIRDAELQKIPYMLVVGEKEQKGKKINIRKRGEKKQSLSASRLPSQEAEATLGRM